MATAPRRRYAPRVPAEERRRQVLDAALTLIAEHGYAGVSMEAVAREVGVAKPVVYDLFSNLGELLAELLDHEEQRALAQLAAVIPASQPEAHPATVLADSLIAFLRAVSENPRPWRLIVMPPEATPQVVREHVDAGRAQVVAQLESLVRWGVAQLGGPLRDVDVELAAQGLMAAGEHAARLTLTDPGRYPPERFGDLVRTVMATLDQVDATIT
jgi:AcrR family transcriptional regulator